MSKNNAKLHPVTLLEVLVVLALLATVLGLTAVSAVHFLNSQKFLSRVDQVADQLQLAQDVMAYFDTQVEVVLEKTGQGVALHLTTEAPLPPILNKRFKKKVHVPYVEALYWQNQEVGAVSFVFQTNREHYPKGTLVFRSSVQEQPVSLDLLGYPAALKVKGQGIENTPWPTPPYPQEVYGTTTIR